MISIPLTRGMAALVDDEDTHLAAFRWQAWRGGSGRRIWYAVRSLPRREGGGRLYLHRVVLDVTDPALDVDHRDGNGLDCRRRNLRVATRSQNLANRGPNRNNTHGFKGVTTNPNQKLAKPWQAGITVNRRRIHLGRFATPEEAARAYDAGARKFFGGFARLNFPTGETRP